MKAVIIDLSRGSEIKILNTRITSGVTILSGYYMGVSPEEDPIEVTAKKLEQEGLLNLPAFIIPSNELVSKQIIHLPKMPDKEIQKVLPRKIAETLESQEPIIYNYLKNGMVEDRQVEKMEISVFFCEKQRFFDFLNRLKSLNILPAKVIPETQCLKTLVELNPLLHSEKKGVALLDMMSQRINLNIFKHTYWGLERDFMFRVEPGDDLGEEDFSRISTELNRTFQYFKQRNRNFSIDNVVLFGSGSHIEHLKNLINDNLGITALTISPGHISEKVTLPAQLRESSEFISIFAVSILAAVTATTKKFLDLFPREYKEKSRFSLRLIGLSISTIIILAILAVSTAHFEKIKSSYKEDLEKIDKTYRSMMGNMSVIEKTRKDRADFYKRRFYIDSPIKYSYAAADFIRRLSLVANEDVELMELEIEPFTQTFKFLLTGKINAPDNIAAQFKFLRFYQSVKRFEDMVRVESSNVKVNAGENNKKRIAEENPGQPGTNKKQVELYFTITGEVEPL